MCKRKDDLRCFGLDLAHEYVLRVGKLVLVKGVVLDCRAVAMLQGERSALMILMVG